MAHFSMPRLRAAILSCMVLLLAACGSQASDSDGDDDWPAIRDVPAGTLAWTVVYKGTGTHQNSESKEVVVLQRKLQGQAHMAGFTGNPEEPPPATPMDGINKAMEACGDDTGCQQEVTARMMAMARKDPGALEHGMRDAMAERLRDTTWVGDSCTAVGEVDDTSTWTGMTEAGIRTGHGTRGGKRTLDDCATQVAEGDSRPRLVADDNTKTYKLALAPGVIRVPATFDGAVEQSLGRDVEFPALVVEGIRYDRLDRPLKGSATLHMGSDRGLYNESWGMPLTETVSWTFTPDPH